MSMKATVSVCSAWATFRATVDLPDPDPPAMPMMNGFIAPPPLADWSRREKARGPAGRKKGVGVSQSGIGPRAATRLEDAKILERRRLPFVRGVHGREPVAR